MEEIVVGIDVGTTKVCTLVGRIEDDNAIRILGVGIEPSEGIKKGTIIDIETAAQAISRSVKSAESTSGLEITNALVSMAGAHVASINSREIIHVIQRGFAVDGQEGIRTPVGMHGYNLEVEAHIITAANTTVDNLRKCVEAANVDILQFVLNPLASAEVVLTEQERQMGVAVIDIGGGTTDLAIYVNGDVWHTMVLAVGGNHVTQDVAHGLRLPVAQAEDVKIQKGNAVRGDVGADEYFSIRPFGESSTVQINRQDLAHIIEARVDEIFRLTQQEIKRSGYDGLLPAGLVLTGGSSSLPGIQRIANKVLNLPVRTARPENLVGLVDNLNSPAYSTSVGLLHWALTMHTHDIRPRKKRTKGEKNIDFGFIKKWWNRLIP